MARTMPIRAKATTISTREKPGVPLMRMVSSGSADNTAARDWLSRAPFLTWAGAKTMLKWRKFDGALNEAVSCDFNLCLLRDRFDLRRIGLCNQTQERQ